MTQQTTQKALGWCVLCAATSLWLLLFFYAQPAVEATPKPRRTRGSVARLVAVKRIAPARTRATTSRAAQPADLVLLGARITTMNPKQPKAQALAIVGDRIAAIGSDAQLRPWIGKNTRVLRLQGRWILPGFIESHGHLLGMGLLKSQLDLVGTQSAAQIAQMVAARAQKTPKGQWILGRGWDQNDWSTKKFPNHRVLDGVSGSHPVYLRRIDGHAAWLNKLALQKAGITRSTRAPQGGQIIKDAQGEPTGVLIDKAMSLVSRHIPKPSKAQQKAALRRAMAASLAMGLTSFHDAGVGKSTIALYRELLREGKLPLRMYLMIMGSHQGLLQEHFRRGPEIGLGHGFLTIRSIKLLADGALGSRGAALHEPYHDKHPHTGLLIIDEQKVFAVAKAALRHGFQVGTHAIGDKANHAVLNAYARAFRMFPWRKQPRFRVEHAQILAAKDIPRFARLGVIASMQPTHCTSDMPWVHRRIGKARAQRGAYVWQSLLKSGAKIAAGSDVPVESANPFWGIYAAITRQDAKGNPPSGWYPAQRMTRIQALKAYTLDAAYASFEEASKGSLEVGKYADLIVVDRDILKASPAALRKTRTLLTIVGGKIRFTAKQTPTSAPTSQPTTR